MNKQKQNGSALVILVIILIVAIIAALGFVVWQNSTQNTSQPDTSENKPEENNIDTQPNESNESLSGYLVLKDWGVKLKIADTLKSTEIKFSAESNTYAFTTARIEALGGECTKSPYNVTVSLTRHTEKPQPGPFTLLNEQPVNGHYYTTYGPPASCSSFDENGQMQSASQTEIDDRAALKETLASITTI
jgi:hypothetical protein